VSRRQTRRRLSSENVYSMSCAVARATASPWQRATTRSAMSMPAEIPAVGRPSAPRARVLGSSRTAARGVREKAKVLLEGLHPPQAGACRAVSLRPPGLLLLAPAAVRWSARGPS
jgi:hypothetical protein